MQFFVVLASLAALATAYPTVDVPVDAVIEARQVYGECNKGTKIGEYGCYANISNRNDMFEYVGQCGQDNRVHLISRCRCKEINNIPYCY